MTFASVFLEKLKFARHSKVKTLIMIRLSFFVAASGKKMDVDIVMAESGKVITLTLYRSSG